MKSAIEIGSRVARVDDPKQKTYVIAQIGPDGQVLGLGETFEGGHWDTPDQWNWACEPFPQQWVGLSGMVEELAGLLDLDRKAGAGLVGFIAQTLGAGQRGEMEVYLAYKVGTHQWAPLSEEAQVQAGDMVEAILWRIASYPWLSLELWNAYFGLPAPEFKVSRVRVGTRG